MEIRCQADTETDGVLVAFPAGTLDVQGADSMWQAVAEALAQKGPSLLVDLSGVDLITSAGIGTLVRLLHRVQSLGGTLVVFGPNARVRAVIEIVMLGPIFKLCDTIAEARERLAG